VEIVPRDGASRSVGSWSNSRMHGSQAIPRSVSRDFSRTIFMTFTDQSRKRNCTATAMSAKAWFKQADLRILPFYQAIKYTKNMFKYYQE